jgi:hypothetical protein
MPIRINFLAEQLAAEEARRRDPVKRALWAGGALVAVMILWSVSLQLRLVTARAGLSRYETKLAAMEADSKEARLDWAAAGELEKRLAHLQRYSTNRFFSATVLDALQQVVLDDVRVVQLQSAHTYSTNAQLTWKTNLVFPIASRKSWQFWRSSPPQTNVLMLLSNELAAITNRIEALKTPAALTTKIDLSTNRQQVTAHIEITKPLTAVEQVVLTIKARDYGNPPGRRVDEFSKAIATHPYFAQRLLPGEGQGIRLRERAIQPEFDATDPLTPSRPFIPFVIECRYRDTIRANE